MGDKPRREAKKGNIAAQRNAIVSRFKPFGLQHFVDGNVCAYKVDKVFTEPTAIKHYNKPTHIP